MKILAVLGHFDPDSLNGYLYTQVVTYCRSQGHDVHELRLYDHEQEIPFYRENRDPSKGSWCSDLEKNPFYEKNKELMMSSDALIIVCPIYWYSLPSIVKAWIDLITNYFWKYKLGSYAPKAQGFHYVKKVFTITTSSAPFWVLRWLFQNTASRQVDYTFWWMDVPERYFYQIGDVYNMGDERVHVHVRKMLYECYRMLNS